MKLDFDFRYKTIAFNLSEADTEHWTDGHRLRMQEWSGPLSMNALSGVNWDKVLSNFPYYSLRCRDCKYLGDDYNTHGELRNSPVESKQELQSK